MQNAILPVIVGALLVVPGLRLLAQWRRTGAMPEGLLAMFFLGFAVGVPIRLTSAARVVDLGVATEPLNVLALSLLCLSMTAFTIFVARVFRPGDGRASAASLAVLVVLFGACGYLAVSGRAADQTNPVTTTAALVAIGAFGWAFAECFAQYRRMSRQRALGLGDPVVTNRFALWSLWTGGIAMLPIVSSMVRLGVIVSRSTGGPQDAPPAVLSAMMVVLAGSLSVVAIALWLSFFPPPWYLDRITAGGEEVADAG